MNGRQAQIVQGWIGMRPGVNPVRVYMKGFPNSFISREEKALFNALWDEFYPDLGDLYRLPMMVREED